MTEAAVQRLHDWMNAELAKYGAHIDAFYYCPHHTEGIVPAYTKACACRKPAPGMLLRAIAEYDIDPAVSLLIGDGEHDVVAAANAGVKGVLYPGGNLCDCVRAAAGESR